MAREINAELLDTKIEKAQQDLVKAKHRYDAAAATLKDLLDKRCGEGLLIKKGEIVKKVKEEELLETLRQELLHWNE